MKAEDYGDVTVRPQGQLLTAATAVNHKSHQSTNLRESGAPNKESMAILGGTCLSFPVGHFPNKA
jgi:hypothetical protein